MWEELAGQVVHRDHYLIICQPRLSENSLSIYLSIFVCVCTRQLCGAALLGGGIALLSHPQIVSYQTELKISSSDPFVSVAAITFVVVGAVAFVVGFLGCCGALKEQPLFLLIVSCSPTSFK